MNKEPNLKFFVFLFGILGLITMMVFLVYNQRDLAMKEVCFNTYVTDPNQHGFVVNSFPYTNQRGFPRCEFGDPSQFNLNKSIEVWQKAHYQIVPNFTK